MVGSRWERARPEAVWPVRRHSRCYLSTHTHTSHPQRSPPTTPYMLMASCVSGSLWPQLPHVSRRQFWSMFPKVSQGWGWGGAVTVGWAPVVLCGDPLISHFLLSLLISPVSHHHSLRTLARITFQISYPHPNPFLGICFSGDPLKTDGKWVKEDRKPKWKKVAWQQGEDRSKTKSQLEGRIDLLSVIEYGVREGRGASVYSQVSGLGSRVDNSSITEVGSTSGGRWDRRGWTRRMWWVPFCSCWNWSTRGTKMSLALWG